jgi:signal transduction histidine kinase
MLDIADVSGKFRSSSQFTAFSRRSLGRLAEGWLGGIGLALAVGAAYFVVARLSLGLLMKPDGVAVFWPAAGISSGVLIALGPRARWSVALGAVIGTIPANLLGDRDVWAAAVFALSNAAEALIAAAFIQHCFGAGFSLNKLRYVLGLFAAAVLGTALSGIGGAIGYKLFHSPTTPILTTWQHWFVSDALGILAVAPVLIGIAVAAREQPRRIELLESFLVLALLAATTAFIVSLPEEPWQTVVPAALLFPMLLWLAARSRPVFTAAGAFMVCLTIVWATVLGIGHFGDPRLPISDRILQAQAVVLIVALGSLVLAALFSERRECEERLAHSNMLLKRERDNKLTNAQAIVAAIGHEVKQPLTAIVANGEAAQRFLIAAPPNLEKAHAALGRIADAGCRAGDILDGLRGLFSSGVQETHPVSINEIIQDTLNSLQSEFARSGVAVHADLNPGLPNVAGHTSRLREVMTNLFVNATEAMSSVARQNRVLCVATKSGDCETISVTIDDSGPGIHADKLASIFNAFVTTKRHGMGLGLAICRTIIEQHGGVLTAGSNSKGGARFEVVLPVVPTTQELSS